MFFSVNITESHRYHQCCGSHRHSTTWKGVLLTTSAGALTVYQLIEGPIVHTSACGVC